MAASIGHVSNCQGASLKHFSTFTFDEHDTHLPDTDAVDPTVNHAILTDDNFDIELK